MKKIIILFVLIVGLFAIGCEIPYEESSSPVTTTEKSEEVKCPTLTKVTDYDFYWADSIEGNEILWLDANFLKRVEFSDDWELSSIPSDNEFMSSNLACRRGERTGESVNKLYCRSTLMYTPEIKRLNLDSDGNIISTDRFELIFVFDITDKDLRNANDLNSLTIESITCRRPSW